MPTAPLDLRRLAAPLELSPAPDGELLARFLRRRDEAAFAELVRRHAPMVLGTCRRVLGNAADADDAFQAAFVVLARRAAGLTARGSVGDFLYGVAVRTALKAKTMAARRRTHEANATPTVPGPDRDRFELLAALDEELARLPGKYRGPVVLCELEGRPRRQVAAALGVAEGTISSRLATAHRMLGERLRARGLVGAAVAAALAAPDPAQAGPLVAAAVRAAVDGPPPGVSALVTEVMKMLLLRKVGVGAVFTAAVVIAAVVAGAAGLALGYDPPKDANPANPAPARPPGGKNAGEAGAGAERPLPAQAPGRSSPAGFRGTVSDATGRRVPGAMVIAVGDVGNGARLTAATDADGRFSLVALPAGKTAFPGVYVFAVKAGAGPAITLFDPSHAGAADLTLPAAAPFGGVVKDGTGRPVAGAEVQVGYVHRSGQPGSQGASWGYVPSAAVRGTPAEPFFFATTDPAGRFRFPTLPAGGELIFRVSATGFAELDTGAGGPKEGQHVARADAPPGELVLGPEAVIRGRVMSAVPGVSPDAATVRIEGTNSLHGFRRAVKPAADGRFTAAGLPAGPMTVVLDLTPGTPATAAGELVTTAAGATSDIRLTVIAGVEVTGRVVVRDTNEPVQGVVMATDGLVNPAGFHWGGQPTDAAGRFSLRLPPGRVTVLVWRTPGDYRETDSRRQEVDVPAGAAKFELPRPFEMGKVVDVAAALRVPAAPAGAATGPVPVAAERPAAALVRQLGGWYVLDGDGHVVEVNMVYHEEPGGRRADNRLTDSDGALRAAGKFPRLKKLYLRLGQATDDGLAALDGLSGLEVLYVWDATQVSDAGIAHLAGLPKLRGVHISNSRLGDGALAVFAKMPSIRSLSLQGNNFSDAGMKHLSGMKQLQSLWVGMGSQPITDAGVRHLAGLTGLEQLDLQSARLTAGGVAALNSLTELRSLYIDGPAGGDAIGDADIEPLLGMKKLKRLSLGNTRLTAAGVRRLIGLPDLRDLSLTSPSIGEEAREGLKKERPSVQLRISGPASRP